MKVSPDLYLRRLRTLGAWWRLGSSALEPGLLIESGPVGRIAPSEAALGGHGGVAFVTDVAEEP